jgi:hypothetical protein
MAVRNFEVEIKDPKNVYSRRTQKVQLQFTAPFNMKTDNMMATETTFHSVAVTTFMEKSFKNAAMATLKTFNVILKVN